MPRLSTASEVVKATLTKAVYLTAEKLAEIGTDLADEDFVADVVAGEDRFAYSFPIPADKTTEDDIDSYRRNVAWRVRKHMAATLDPLAPVGTVTSSTADVLNGEVVVAIYFDKPRGKAKAK